MILSGKHWSLGQNNHRTCWYTLRMSTVAAVVLLTTRFSGVFIHLELYDMTKPDSGMFPDIGILSYNLYMTRDFYSLRLLKFSDGRASARCARKQYCARPPQ